jgi:hypothetical protein
MLRSHPQIFMPVEKEPRYFASDLYSRFAVQRDPPPALYTLSGYLELFAEARPDQLVGEASPQYLRSAVAAERIAELRPDAKIVAILREPADFLRSFHQQMVSSHVETETDLRSAMALEDERRAGRRIPRECHHPKSLLYSEHVRYVEQLRRFHDAFGRERVLVLIYDDFHADNAASLGRVLSFLGVEADAAIETVRTRTLASVRSQRLHRLAGSVASAARNPRSAGPAGRTVNALLPRRLRDSRRVRSLWRRAVYGAPGRSPQADAEHALELRRRFKPEVVAVSEYLGRDLVGEWGYDRIS